MTVWFVECLQGVLTMMRKTRLENDCVVVIFTCQQSFLFVQERTTVIISCFCSLRKKKKLLIYTFFLKSENHIIMRALNVDDGFM